MYMKCWQIFVCWFQHCTLSLEVSHITSQSQAVCLTYWKYSSTESCLLQHHVLSILSSIKPVHARTEYVSVGGLQDMDVTTHNLSLRLERTTF